MCAALTWLGAPSRSTTKPLRGPSTENRNVRRHQRPLHPTRPHRHNPRRTGREEAGQRCTLVVREAQASRVNAVTRNAREPLEYVRSSPTWRSGLLTNFPHHPQGHFRSIPTRHRACSLLDSVAPTGGCPHHLLPAPSRGGCDLSRHLARSPHPLVRAAELLRSERAAKSLPAVTVERAPLECRRQRTLLRCGKPLEPRHVPIYVPCCPKRGGLRCPAHGATRRWPGCWCAAGQQL